MRKTLAGLDVVRLIARGGFASVYEARGAEGQRLAVKQLHADRKAFPRVLQGFEREAEILTSCQIPGVVRAYAYDREDSAIVMEYLDGMSLDRVIDCCREEFPVHTRLLIAVRICDTMQQAHEAGLLHLDLKPSNVIVTTDGRVVVTDFGAGATVQLDETDTGPTIGAINYMSSEQLNHQPLDPRADVYSLGVLTYELLSGKKPYEITKSSALRGALDKVTPLDALGIAELPIEASLAVQRALAFDRETRWRSAQELSAVLRRAAPEWQEDEVAADLAAAVARSWRIVLALAQPTARTVRDKENDQEAAEASSAGGGLVRSTWPRVALLAGFAGLAVLAGVGFLVLRGSGARQASSHELVPTVVERPAEVSAPPLASPGGPLAGGPAAAQDPDRSSPALGKPGSTQPAPVTGAATRAPAVVPFAGSGTLRVSCLPLNAEVSLLKVVRLGGSAEDVTSGASGQVCPFFIPNLPAGSYRMTVKVGDKERSTTVEINRPEVRVRWRVGGSE